MESYDLQTLGGYINPTLDFIRAGFNQVNAAQGLLIAFVAVVAMRRWRQLLPIVIAASVIYTIVDALLPVLQSSAPFRLPDIMSASFWQKVAGQTVGLLIIIAMFFAVKNVVFRGGGGEAAVAAPAGGKKRK